MEAEQQLLHDLQEGKRDAGRRLYDRYGGGLMAVCLRYLGGRDEARDVLQDVFVKILTRINAFTYQGEGSLRAWMTRIAANESISFLRRDGHLMFNHELPDVPDVPDVEPSRVPPDVLHQMISALPPGYRTVLNLFVFEQMPHREIARQLGISEGTSASQYLRAKKTLAHQIDEYLKQQER